MVGCGYTNPPSCLPYEAVEQVPARGYNPLIIVPASAVWGDRTSQPLGLLKQPIVEDVVEDQEPLEELFYDTLELGSDSESERGDPAEPAKALASNGVASGDEDDGANQEHNSVADGV